MKTKMLVLALLLWAVISLVGATLVPFAAAYLYREGPHWLQRSDAVVWWSVMTVTLLVISAVGSVAVAADCAGWLDSQVIRDSRDSRPGGEEDE